MTSSTIPLPEVGEPIQRVLGIEYDHEGDEACVVSYGGPCPRKAAMEVYGLPFCQLHGAEAAAMAVDEFGLDFESTLETIEPTSPWNFTRDKKLADLLDSMAKGFAVENRLWGDAEAVADADREGFTAWRMATWEGRAPEAAKRAYPCKEEFVDSYTKEPVDLYEREEEYYGLLRQWMYMHQFMRVAYSQGHTLLLRRLEPIRECVAAECACLDALSTGEEEDEGAF